jgi:alkaline phosphatase
MAYMRTKRTLLLVLILTNYMSLSGQKSNELSSNSTRTSPKNVIFMIGDGMGYNTMLAADYYNHGSLNQAFYDKFPVKFALSHYPAKTGSYPDKLQWSTGYNPFAMWNDFNYALSGSTESGAAATALSTGFKTYSSSIGMDIDFKPLVNLTQVAKSMHKSCGVVTSVFFSHATPAGFTAHSLTRSNYRQIAYEMLLGTSLDVIMGTGNPDFDNNGNPSHNTYRYIGDSTIWVGLKEGNSVFYVNGIPDTVEDCNNDGVRDPWKLIQDKESFRVLANGNTPVRILGIPKVFETLQQERGGDKNADPYAVPFNQTVPTLMEMTLGALNVLDNNPNGFFVMIEGGAIDWAAHNNQKGRLIEEQTDFNNAIEAVIEWVNKNSSCEETLLIITADHETGMIWGPGSGPPNIFNQLINNGKNVLPGFEFHTTDHSNSLVPFYAKGSSSEIFGFFADEIDPVRGRFIQNSEVAQGIKFLWNAY